MHRIFAGGALLVLLAACGSVAGAQYTAVDLYSLQAPAGWNKANAACCHQTAFAGQVVGATWEPSDPGANPTPHPVLWKPDGSAEDLNPNGFDERELAGTDGIHQFGYAITGGIYTPVVWSGSAASATFLNKQGFASAQLAGSGGGQFVGSGKVQVTDPEHALLWNSLTAQPIDLTPAYESHAYGASGNQQVGSGNVGEIHAFLWTGSASSARDLNPSPNLPGIFESEALATDGLQQVGDGWGPDAAGTTFPSFSHALLWSGSAGSAADLNPHAFDYSIAYGVRNGKQVGAGITENGYQHALVWSGSSASAIDLHLLLPNAFDGSIASSIDDAGNVFGFAYNIADGQEHAIEWLPVAELSGDYNHNGVVDAADYVVWRKSNGSQSNYNTWRSHFGPSAGSGSVLPSTESLSAAVPEPATRVLFGVGLLAVVGAFSNRSRARGRGRGQPAAPSASRSLPVATMFHAHAAGRAPSCLLWTVLLLTSATSPALTAPATIYNLGTLGASESYGYAINASGQVAGYNTDFGAQRHAFLYSGTPGSDGAMADLGTLPSGVGPGSIAYGINASGQVVGDSDNWENYITRAFLYTGTPDSGGGMSDLGDLFPDAGGTADCRARGINASGQIVGYSQAAPYGSYHAFLIGTPESGGAIADLGTLGGTYSAGYGVNNAGAVTGESSLTGDTANHAFRYTGTPGSGGAMADLGTLPGKTYSQGLAINDVGQVVGSSGNSLSDTTQHAFLYTGTPGSGGAMADLGTLGGTYSAAQAINTSGQVVGQSSITAGGAKHAFLYTGTPGVDGHMIDLDTWLNANNPSEGAKWTLASAAGVTDTGLITGEGTYNDGPGGLNDGPRAFLLDASALVSTSFPGDYNHNGKVDAADYVAWRKNQGTTNTLPNDPTGGTIGTTQYNTWRTHFGQSAGSGIGASANTVPEPAMYVLIILVAGGVACHSRLREKSQ